MKKKTFKSKVNHSNLWSHAKIRRSAQTPLPNIDLLIYFIVTIHSLKSINTISEHEQRRVPI